MKRTRLAVIGVGNMAKAIIEGILGVGLDIYEIILYDINRAQYTSLSPLSEKFVFADSIVDAVERADTVLLSVKPQNYSEILSEIKSSEGYSDKLYISIGAGISTGAVRASLGDVAVIRVLPNVPMLIGKGVSVICRNENVDKSDFLFVKNIFESAGSVIDIDEDEMNRIIGVTSSSPAYVFKFIDAICKGAAAQGLETDGLLDAVCDMVIGSALMLKGSKDTPEVLIAKVASKGGTTERALATLDEYRFSEGIGEAMKACTARADELGSDK
ncbi:MAG: pyrroline-5-carboxylate reductase [Clostridia bacterium]|nr:pyrroline-5-carboxylate reductase [Clostridia bacterium]